MGIIIALIVLVGLVAFGFFAVRRAKECQREASKRIQKVLNVFRPEDIEIGDELMVGDPGAGEEKLLSVISVARYQDAEDSNDFWYEFGVIDSDQPGVVFYLSCELDDEDRRTWYMHHEVPQDEVTKVPELAAIFDGAKPPRKFDYIGITWNVVHDCYHYDVGCKDRRVDRPEESQYPAKVTDYVNRNGSRVMSVEIWDGGQSITIGDELGKKLTLIKG